MRADPGPLLLMALVVALTTALTSAATPLMARTSDRAIADAVRTAGDRSALTATFTRPNGDVGPRTRDPKAAEEVRAAATGAHYLLPKRVAALVQSEIASVTTTPLQLLDAGPGRYLTLVYLDDPTGAPRVHYTSGGPPRATVGAARAAAQLPDSAPPWPVQVAVSQAAATALGLTTGDRVTAQDDRGAPVDARVSGVFTARDPSEPAWTTAPQLLHPTRGFTPGSRAASAAALVSSAALPDLRLAVPATDLTQRVVDTVRPQDLRWADSGDLVRALVSLKASPDGASTGVSWDTNLDQVLNDGRARVVAARGQADVLLVALMLCALLVLWQAADLVVRRRAHAVVLTRERGGSLVEIAVELFAETIWFVTAGAALGLLASRLAVGQVGLAWWVPLPFLAASAAAVTGAVLASRATDPRRTPANRTARRVAARDKRLRRSLFVCTVLAVTALSFVALRQDGVVGSGSGGATAASAPTWWAVAGALVVIVVAPRGTRLLLDATRRTSGSVAFFVAARVRESGARTLPLLVVTVTVAQLTFAIALASTEERGQAAGALLSVGGDARVTPAAGHSARALASTMAAAPGVRAAVAARVEEEVAATSRTSADTVRLVVLDAPAYEHLLAVSPLPDAPQLDRLTRSQGSDAVPALVLGGPAGLLDGLMVSGPTGRTIPLTVVGTAPQVGDPLEPVIVVDGGRYAAAGGSSTPNTVWAVGPDAGAAARAADGTATVALAADALAVRRSAPLASGLVRLSVASSSLLLLFAVLGVVLGAAGEADPRAESLGRLRSLGLRDRQLWGLLAGELVAPVLVGSLAGIALGLSAAWAMFGSLSLEQITAQVGAPDVSVPPSVLLGVAALVVTVLVLTQLEWRRLRGVALGQLLRGGPPR